MNTSAPIIARAHRKLSEKMQEGTILSHTTIHSGNTSRTIALIELHDGSHVLAPLTAKTLDTRHQTLEHSPKSNVQSPESLIGLLVLPRLRLRSVNEQGLRFYDVAFELTTAKLAAKPGFPGYILALTGPSGVGKSTISKLLVNVCSELVTPVPILTTRKPKEGDDGEYLYVSPKKFSDLQKKRSIVALVQLPSSSEKRWYGYRAKDIERIWNQGKLPLVITEMHLLQGLSNHFGRRSILSFGLLPPGKSRRTMLSHLLFRLRKRGRETEGQICERLKHAVADLTFFKERAELFDHFIVNEKLENVIEKLKPHIPGLKEA